MGISALLRWLSALFLHSSLFFLIGSIIFVQILSDKQVLKDSLATSGAYASFVDTVIDSNIDESTQTLSSLPLADQNVRTIITKSFSPQILKTQTDAVIDNVYEWLDGRSSKLSFRYDFTESKNTMNASLASYAAERVATLPNCDRLPEQINVFTISCKPMNITSDFVRAQTLADLESSDLLKDPVITQDNLPKAADGENLDVKYSFVPKLYQLMQVALPVSIALLVVAIGLYIFVRLPVQKGLRAFGKDILSNGIMLIILTVVFGYIVPNYTNSYGLSGNQLSNLFSKVSDTYIHRVDILVINIAIQMAAAGLGLLLILRINKSNNIYSALKSKSGLVSSVGKSNTVAKRPSRPPVQTSESNLKARKRKSSTAAKKYHGAKW